MDVSKLSKRLSYLLRHGANEARLSMDAAGWVAIDEVLRSLRIDRATLDRVVRENKKNRLELHEGRVRAAQGHSRANMPVTLEALEASWTRFESERSVWHGTNVDAAGSIARDRIHPGERTHVHLAEALDSTVGMRAQVDVMLEVSSSKLRAAGLALYRSANGVILVREVPASCVVGVRGVTDRGREHEPRLRGLFAPPRP